jgi:hypothetical protein
LLRSFQTFHPDGRVAAHKDLTLQLHHEVRQQSQNRSHGEVEWRNL